MHWCISLYCMYTRTIWPLPMIYAVSSVCGGLLLSSKNGNLTSPGYDGTSNYINNLNCEWVIQNPHPSTTTVYLVFGDFRLEEQTNCQNDYLEIRQGRSQLFISASWNCWLWLYHGCRHPFFFLGGNTLVPINRINPKQNRKESLAGFDPAFRKAHYYYYYYFTSFICYTDSSPHTPGQSGSWVSTDSCIHLLGWLLNHSPALEDDWDVSAASKWGVPLLTNHIFIHYAGYLE